MSVTTVQVQRFTTAVDSIRAKNLEAVMRVTPEHLEVLNHVINGSTLVEISQKIGRTVHYVRALITDLKAAFSLPNDTHTWKAVHDAIFDNVEEVLRFLELVAAENQTLTTFKF